MKLKKDWHRQKMLYVSFLAATMAGAEVVVPLFQDAMPRGWFAAVSFAVVFASGIFHALEFNHGPE